ncbi:MAG: ABC transporter substrate-binding protein [Hyphomicrobiaceae bacterium]|nr:ABC transporter substrate-binding protein [Hyphomicrobiaceae bacterium]
MAGPETARSDLPARVVSINLCTDQLALMIAAPGQIASVSFLARDRSMSVMADAARAYPENHGLAEQVFLMKPELVLAGTYMTASTVDLLRRLGITVEEFAPATSFADIRRDIARMGELLGHPKRAAELIAELDTRLAAASRVGGPRSPLAALYYANSYTSGRSTLPDEIVTLGGLRNLSRELGLAGVEKLPLEILVRHAPRVLVTGESYEGAPALAQEGFRHPALKGLGAEEVPAATADKYWICGGPFTAEAVRLLAEARDRVLPGLVRDRADIEARAPEGNVP